MRLLVIIGIVAAVFVAALLIIRSMGSDTIFPPKQGSTLEGAADIVEDWRADRIERASIPLDQIRGGGPRKDGIPSLDHPAFVSVREAGSQGLRDDTFGLAVEANGIKRFYPYNILVWHEIVNDTVGDQPLLVTYCPLCFTGIVFDRTVAVAEGDAQALEFGVSGLLFDNNLLMYNRVLEQDDPPESLWSQARGEAVAGPLTGTQLQVWPQSETLSWGEWKQSNPEGEVLSRDTGYFRNYSNDPYGDYYERDNNRLLFELSREDNRLPRKEVVLTVRFNEVSKAYVRSALEEQVPVQDEIGEVPVVWRRTDSGGLGLFNRDTNERIGVAESFWFSWAATWPDTELWPDR